jgi:hypothetical protein
MSAFDLVKQYYSHFDITTGVPFEDDKPCLLKYHDVTWHKVVRPLPSLSALADLSDYVEIYARYGPIKFVGEVYYSQLYIHNYTLLRTKSPGYIFILRGEYYLFYKGDSNRIDIGKTYAPSAGFYYINLVTGPHCGIINVFDRLPLIQFISDPMQNINAVNSIAQTHWPAFIGYCTIKNDIIIIDGDEYYIIHRTMMIGMKNRKIFNLASPREIIRLRMGESAKGFTNNDIHEITLCKFDKWYTGGNDFGLKKWELI